VTVLPALSGAALPALSGLIALPALGTSTTPPTTEANSTSGQGPEWGEAAPIGLLIILLMGGALFLLIKSMNRNLRKVPATFDAPPPAPAGKTHPADPATPGRHTDTTSGIAVDETGGGAVEDEIGQPDALRSATDAESLIDPGSEDRRP
jgi:hypothetical protein